MKILKRFLCLFTAIVLVFTSGFATVASAVPTESGAQDSALAVDRGDRGSGQEHGQEQEQEQGQEQNTADASSASDDTEELSAPVYVEDTEEELSAPVYVEDTGADMSSGPVSAGGTDSAADTSSGPVSAGGTDSAADTSHGPSSAEETDSEEEELSAPVYVEDEEEEAYTYSFTDDTIAVTAAVSPDSVFSQDETELQVDAIHLEGDTVENDCFSQLSEDFEGEVLTVDLSFRTEDGEAVEQVQGSTELTLTLPETDGNTVIQNVEVFHYAEGEGEEGAVLQVEDITVDAEANTITFDAEELGAYAVRYTVDFYFNGREVPHGGRRYPAAL